MGEFSLFGPPGLREDFPLQVFIKGVGESLANVVMGATLLTLAWFIAAIGIRRRPPDEPAGV